MKLENFVTETLVEIISGVKAAQEAADKLGAEINPYRGSSDATQSIDFDVEVSTTSGTATKGRLGVFVGPIAAGTQGQSEAQAQSVGRIRFKVALTLPFQSSK